MISQRIGAVDIAGAALPADCPAGAPAVPGFGVMADLDPEGRGTAADLAILLPGVTG